MERKRVLITGGNRGIGLALVKQCLLRADQVFTGCRNPALATELQEQASEYPDTLSVLQLDVTDECSIGSAFETVSLMTEGIDVLISNAAYNANVHETIDELKSSIALQHFRTNALGPIMVIQKFLKLLRKGRFPKIAVISSISGSFEANKNESSFRGYSYAASKAALNMFVMILATQIRGEGIPVVALNPGWVRTQLRNKLAPLSPEQSAEALLKIIDGTVIDDCGTFRNYNGDEIPW